MEETTDYTTTDDTGYSSSGVSDPISSIFGTIGFIVILILIIILVAMLMIGKGVGWIATTATGQKKKEGFEMPKVGPQPCPEHDERCAHFPAL